MSHPFDAAAHAAQPQSAPTEAHSEQRDAPWQPAHPRTSLQMRAVREAAAALVITVGVFVLIGLVWAFVIPRYTGTVVGHGKMSLADPTVTPFVAYLVFLGLTALAGFLLGWLGYRTLVAGRGVLMMCWLSICAGIGALTAAICGSYVADMLFMPSDVQSLEIGDMASVVNGVSVGISGYLIAPFMTAVTYWVMIIAEPASTAPSWPDGSGDVPSN